MLRNTIALALVVLFTLVGCAGPAEVAEVQPTEVTFTTDQGWEATVPAGTMEACQYDDGTGAPCVWTAEDQGSGQGTSFVVLQSYDGPFAELTTDQARTLTK